MYDQFLCTRATTEGKNIKQTVIPHKSQSAAVVIVDQPTDQPTNDQLTAEDLKYSRHSARRLRRATNNLLEVFGGRSIGATVEALLTIVVNWQLS